MSPLPISGTLPITGGVDHAQAKRLALDLARPLREEYKLTPDLVFRDPYLLNFLGLKDSYAEKDMVAAILREMESFIPDLGVGFAFLEQQKRITVDGEDFDAHMISFYAEERPRGG